MVLRRPSVAHRQGYSKHRHIKGAGKVPQAQRDYLDDSTSS
jgi:hypothetical protein